jgi:large subunit ribosomal protein L32e
MGLGFKRRGWYRYSKLGKGRKNKIKWRRQKGRHGKMREETRGSDKTVSIGYGKLDRTSIKLIRNFSDLKNAKEALISGKVGGKKRAEIEKKAKELGIKILNLKQNKETK